MKASSCVSTCAEGLTALTMCLTFATSFSGKTLVDTTATLRSHLTMNLLRCCPKRTWEHWHSAMHMAKKLDFAEAHDIHLQLAEGKVHNGWKIENPVDFHRFQDKPALQMLRHSPTQNTCPGDDKCRISTKTAERRRAPATPISSSDSTVAST